MTDKELIVALRKEITETRKAFIVEVEHEKVRIEALIVENEKFREALSDIARDDVGLQGLIEDGVYEETETSRYYAARVSWRRKHALAALEKQP
jgi:hypothetical protein